MEINCGSVKSTTLEKRLLTCARGEAALAASLVSALVKAQLAFSVSAFFQVYMKLLKNQPKLRGDEHNSFPCDPVDGEDSDEDADEEDEDADEDEEENAPPTEGKKSGAENGLAGGPEENGEDEDDDDEGVEGEDPNDDDEEDDDDDDDDDEDDDDEGGDEENEEDEEDEEEEALQPPKKRKK